MGALAPVFAQWRQAEDDADPCRLLGGVLAVALPALVRGIGSQEEILRHGDGLAVEPAVQLALQPVGAACVTAAWELQGHATVLPPARRPACPGCGGRLKPVDGARPRKLVGLFGPYTLRRPYYTCAECGGGHFPADEAWGLAAGVLSPAMIPLVCDAGARTSFGETGKSILRALQVVVDDNEAQRTTEAMGMVQQARIQLRAETPVCQVAADPGSDVLLLEADGGRVFAGGEWRR